ncbi:MAG: 50S ribosomal protein L11 methyltransferase, partial [Bacteroidales bacterium]|nr:50S ribosomal protein L11 methyltransferase [Bacteroidales bacterium]
MENGFSFKTLAPSEDPMGAAIAEYFKTGKAAKLRVMSEMFDEDEIPVKTLFRTYAQMSQLEKLALEKAQGSILDVGAGSGCHSLALQDMGKEVCAIDISPLSVETMKARGVKDVAEVNLFS